MMNSGELVKMVRQVINEADDNAGVSLLSPDRLSFDENIMELLPRAVAFVQQCKPAALRVNVKSLPASSAVVVASGDGTGYIVLPNDFVSPVSVSLVGWKRPCTRFYARDSHRALLQQNRTTAAGNSRPVCIDDVNASGVRCVRLSPVPAEETAVVDKFVYEAVFNPEEGLGLYDAAMLDAVVYECAALLYTMFERPDAANSYHSLALARCGAMASR